MGVQKVSAMEENSKMKTLANDLTRRLLNTSETLGLEERVRVVDNYSQKLVNSGFGIIQVRKIIINGILGYERRVKESELPGGRKLHRTAEESSGGRSRKKLLGKTEWFKNRRRVNNHEGEEGKSSQPSPPKQTQTHSHSHLNGKNKMKVKISQLS